MDTPADVAGAEPDVTETVITVHRRIRRPLGAAFWAALVAVPLGLAGLAGTVAGPAIEHDLSAAARTALDAQGFDTVKVQVDGVQVTAEVPTGEDRATVAAVLDGLDGAAMVRTRSVFSSKEEAQACADLPKALQKATHRQRIPFVGETAKLTGAGAAMVRHAAGLLKDCPAAVVLVGGHTDTHTVHGSTLSLKRSRVMIRLLEKAGVPSGQLEPRGYGDQYPIARGNGAKARAANQRGSIVMRGA